MARAAGNPFELEGRGGGPDRAHPAKVWSESEIEDKLKGYLEIPPEYWDQIRYGTHLRYFTRGDGFRTGGFVNKNPFDFKPPDGGDEKRFIRLQNGFNDKARGFQQWLLAYEDAEKIFTKPDASVLVMVESLDATNHSLEVAIKGLNDNIRKVADHSKKLEARLSALEKSLA